MSDEKNKDKKPGDFFRKGIRGLRDRMTFDHTDLIRAVDKGDEDMVERILYAGVAPNKKDPLNRRALPMAVDNNRNDIVELLLKAKADPNLPGKDGDLPLRKAVFWENKTIVLLLLQAGAKKDMPNREGVSAMLEAKRNGHTELMALMDDFKDPKRIQQIARDAKKHAEQKKKIATAKAAQQEKKELVEKQKEEATAKAEESLEEKYQVAEKGYLEALMAAFAAKDGKASQLFMAKVDDFNQSATGGMSPLLYAVAQKHSKLATALLEKGADPFHYVKSQKHSPFSRAVADEQMDFVKAVADADPEKTATYCNDPGQLLSPQFLAYKNPALFDLLLSAGADPLWGGKEGVAPIVKAVEKGSIALLPVLIRHQFDINQLIDGETMLEWAVEHNRIDWVNGLLEEDADPNIPTSEGQTALELAQALGDRTEIIALLEKVVD